MARQAMLLAGRRYGSAGLLCAAIGAAVCLAGDPAGEEPLDLKLEERTGSHLVQIDVTVDGPPELVGDLRPRDFEVAVGGRVIEDFLVDGLCDRRRLARDDAPGDTPPAEPPPASPPTPPPANLLLYFDQHHLTMAGRQRSLDVARKFLSELARPFRATIVSSGRSVLTVEPLTTDRSQLLDGLDRLERDRNQWDPFAQHESARVEEVLRALDEGPVESALQVASRLQREETWHTEKALRRFEMVLGRFASFDPPNIVLYFADTMRSEPGAHYLDLLPVRDELPIDMPLARVIHMNLEQRSFSSSSVYERVINAASAHAVRLYTVQAEGRVAQSMPLYSPSAHGSLRLSNPAPDAARLASAQDSLAGWSAETGGRAFLNGGRPAKMARRIEEDLACMYLISFDASLVPSSQPLAVSVRVARPGVSTRTRGRMYVPTESQVLTSRLLTAFLGVGADAEDPQRLRGAVAPIDFRDGKYTALVHVIAPAMRFPGAVWDVGASLLSRDAVREAAAGHVRMSAPGAPLVFEAEMSIPPGEYEVVMVAHENTTDQIVRGQVEGVLVDPREEGTAVVSIAVLQASRGSVFYRKAGEVRSGEGRVACGDSCTVRTDETTAILSLVCRGSGKGRSVWRAERSLAGESSVAFPPQEVELEKGARCIQLRDLVPESTLGEGAFVYEVRVVEGGQELATARRDLYAMRPPD